MDVHLSVPSAWISGVMTQKQAFAKQELRATFLKATFVITRNFTVITKAARLCMAVLEAAGWDR
jgi:hypothetical protein